MQSYFFDSAKNTRFLKRVTLALSICAMATLVQAADNAGSALKTYAVKPGDTLDKVVRTQMGDSPLRADLLKEALISQNPNAFTKGSPKMLLAGATLQLPNQEALVRKHFGPALQAPEAEPAQDHSQVRKHWVRYP